MKNDELKILMDMFQSANSLSNHEGDLIWSRFNAFILVHTIFLGIIIAQILNSDLITFQFRTEYLRLISLVGFILTFLWLISTKRGYEAIEYWNSSAREIEEKISKKFKMINLLTRGEEYFIKNREVTFDYGDKKIKYLQRSCFTRIFKFDTEWTAYTSIVLILLMYGLVFVLSFKGIFDIPFKTNF